LRQRESDGREIMGRDGERRKEKEKKGMCLERGGGIEVCN
jgi:hypothetical protein